VYKSVQGPAKPKTNTLNSARSGLGTVVKVAGAALAAGFVINKLKGDTKPTRAQPHGAPPVRPNYPPTSRGQRTALIITITYHWLSEETGKLPGTKADGIRMSEFLRERGFTVIWMNDFDFNYGDPMYPTAANIKTKINISSRLNGQVLHFGSSTPATAPRSPIPEETGRKTGKMKHWLVRITRILSVVPTCTSGTIG